LPAAAIISAIYLFWLLTLGIILVEIYGDNKIQPRKLVLSLVQNPLLLSVLAGLIIVVFRIQLPGFLDKTIRLFAGSVTAVVLFSLGIFLGMQQFGKLQEWYRVLVLVVLTMLILPFIFYLVLAQTNIPAQLLKASVIDASMPLGLTPYALSVLYNLKTTLVARVVVLGTMVSVLVIPLWMVILG
jgi:predicted permease